MASNARRAFVLLAGGLAASAAFAAPTDATRYDVLITGGTVYDGSGGPPFVGDVAIHGDRIAYVGPQAPHPARERVDAHGKAVAPGFINMLAHPEASLLIDGRALSDLRQGVTLEVLGEDSMGPLTPEMKALGLQRQGDIRYTIDWTTLGEYLHRLEQRGIGPNVASYVGAGTVRTYVLGERDVQPTAAQLAQMRTLVHQAMEEGAVGVTTALIYSPNGYARTPELIALATESARCGGIYSVHMRSEGDRLLEAVQETVDIARASGAPAEIYHLKVAGRRNWDKLDALIAAVDKARAGGTRITADMYVYTAGATGLDAAMPPWVQDGGLEAWIERLRDPKVRARVIADMRDPAPAWENLYGAAGADGTLLLAFKNPQLKPLTGKTLAEVARQRGVSPEDAAIDLVIAGRRRLLPHVGGQHPARGGAPLGELRFRRAGSGARERVPQVQPASTRLRQLRARARQVRPRGQSAEPAAGDSPAGGAPRRHAVARRPRTAEEWLLRRCRGVRSRDHSGSRHLRAPASARDGCR